MSVEVFLDTGFAVRVCWRLLHVRGGVSKEIYAQGTDVGLLHVRGDVSYDGGQEQVPHQSSPRPWRCFQLRR